MTRSLCHLVPACALALASGCFLDHGRDAADRDAGGTTPGADASVAPPPRADAGPAPRPRPDPPPRRTECPEARADATCLDSFVVEPGVPFELPIAFEACGCCPETQCLVDVDPEGRRIHLTTALCPDPCDCAACFPTVGSCSVPALERGTWTVEVNGGEAFELPVEDEITESPIPPACVTYARPDGCEPSDPLRGEPQPADEVCVNHPSIENVRVELIEDCPSCTHGWGPCRVDVEPRLTSDLPPGGEIRITATRYASGCDVACTAECIESTRHCAVPRLVDGHFYRVWLDGRLVTSFTAGEPGRTCDR